MTSPNARRLIKGILRLTQVQIHRHGSWTAANDWENMGIMNTNDLKKAVQPEMRLIKEKLVVLPSYNKQYQTVHVDPALGLAAVR